MTQCERQQRRARGDEISPKPLSFTLALDRDGRVHQSQRVKGLPRDLWYRLAVDLHSPVERTHASNVHSATQLGQRRNSRRILADETLANQRRSLIGGKKSLVVGQHSEIVALDQAVRRIAIHDVYIS